MSQAYHIGHQGPGHSPGYGPYPPQPPRGYPEALPPFGGYPPPPPRPPGPPSYQGYFNDYPQQPQYGHHHYQREDTGCPSFLRGCLAALCCCCLLEECCGGRI